MIDARRAPRHRPHAWAVLRRARAERLAAMLLGVMLFAGCAAPASGPPLEAVLPTSAAPSTSDSPVSGAAPVISPLVRGRAPVAVSIPAIDLAEPLIDLGIGADGGMEVPADFDDVGWFTGGGRPGGYGPLVIAAHVDSPSGPAVFIRLRDLVPGDTVEVTDDAATVHLYRVVEVADYPKAAFPTARVFGAVATDELRLITCGGVFDSGAGSYEDNRVVYAVRADS